jgi:hypothetical protein
LPNPPANHDDETGVTAHDTGTATGPTIHTTRHDETSRLELLLRACRRCYADLVAAARAALAADADGEPDPWSYLRDELPPPPPGHPLAGDQRPRRRWR